MLTITPSHGVSRSTPKVDTRRKWNCSLSKLPSTNGQSQSEINTFQRYKKTRPEATPHKLETLKYLAEFMAKPIKGVLDPNGKPTVQTVRNYLRCFVSGWNIDNFNI